MSLSTYRLGASFVVVETGMPHENVQIGFGASVSEAQADLEDTLIQSTGPDAGESDALEWAVSQNWMSPDDLDALERIE